MIWWRVVRQIWLLTVRWSLLLFSGQWTLELPNHRFDPELRFLKVISYGQIYITEISQWLRSFDNIFDHSHVMVLSLRPLVLTMDTLTITFCSVLFGDGSFGAFWSLRDLQMRIRIVHTHKVFLQCAFSHEFWDFQQT